MWSPNSGPGSLAHRNPNDMVAWELAVRGCALFRGCSAAENRAARNLFQQALAQDRKFPWAYYLLALTYQRGLINQWDTSIEGTLARMAELSEQFERLHTYDSRSKVITAYVMVYRGMRAGAIEQLHCAIDQDPNNPLAYSLLGQALAMDAEPEAALEQFEIAIRLSPHDHDLWSLRTATALTHFAAEDYDQAVKWASAAARLRPDVPITTATLASAAALSGDLDSARNAVADLQQRNPRLSADGFQVAMASTRADIAKRFLDGLTRAGFRV